MKKFLSVLFISLIITGISFSQTNVSPGDGTLGTAIAGAASGDVLVLENGGVYNETSDSMYVIDKVLTIKAQDSEGAMAKITFNVDSTLVNRVNFFQLNEGGSLTLDGLEFYGMSDVVNEFRTVNDFIILADNAVAGSLTILNSNFNNANGWLLSGGVGGSMENITIDNSMITECKGGPHFKDGDLTGSITVTNSTIMNISDRFLRIQSGDAEGYVDHCTVYNVAGKRLIMAKGNNKRWVVTNSIFSTFTGGSPGDCIRPGDNEADSLAYCILYNNVGLHGDLEIVSDTSSADPMFTDADNGDLTLLEGSPALTMASDGGAIGDPRWVSESTDVMRESDGIPNGYALHQNYPNPFNPTTAIKFDLAESGFTSLKVFNMLGQQVAELVNETMNAGSYSVDFDASELTSGIYFYNIQSNGFTKTSKMILMK